MICIGSLARAGVADRDITALVVKLIALRGQHLEKSAIKPVEPGILAVPVPDTASFSDSRCI